MWEDFMLVRNVERFLKEEKNQSTNVELIQAFNELLSHKVIKQYYRNC